MTPDTVQPGDRPSILSAIHKGMAVYDVNDEKVGSVSEVYFGTRGPQDASAPGDSNGAPDPEVYESDSLVENLADALSAESNMPEAIRNRLLHHGYIRIDTAGLFANDRYAMPEQIATVNSDRVTLAVAGDTLVER